MQGSPVRKIWNGERRSPETIALGRHGVGRETIDACDFSRGSRHYCPILLPLKLTATESTEPPNPLLSLTPTKVRRPLCALRLCGSIPVHHRLLPHASPAQINSHRFHRSTQSSFHPAHLQWPSSSVRSLLCGFIPQPTVFFIFSTTIINRRDAEFAET